MIQCLPADKRGRTVFYADRFVPKGEREADTGGEVPRGIALLKRFTVFNVAQCEGLAPKPFNSVSQRNTFLLSARSPSIDRLLIFPVTIPEPRGPFWQSRKRKSWRRIENGGELKPLKKRNFVP
jgi:hypothetical protein